MSHDQSSSNCSVQRSGADHIECRPPDRDVNVNSTASNIRHNMIKWINKKWSSLSMLLRMFINKVIIFTFKDCIDL